MHFSGGINRPPYETADGYLQTTEGCSHNTCLFCTYFKDQKFRKSTIEEIEADIKEIPATFGAPKRIFLLSALWVQRTHENDSLHSYGSHANCPLWPFRNPGARLIPSPAATLVREIKGKRKSMTGCREEERIFGGMGSSSIFYVSVKYYNGGCV